MKLRSRWRAPHPRRPQREPLSRAERKRAHSLRPPGTINQEIGDIWRDSAVWFAIQHDRGRQRAISETEYLLQGEASIWRGFAKSYAQPLLYVLDERVATHGLA